MIVNGIWGLRVTQDEEQKAWISVNTVRRPITCNTRPMTQSTKQSCRQSRATLHTSASLG